MMNVFLFCFMTVLLVTTAAQAQLRWLTANSFTANCTIHTECVVNAACTPTTGSLRLLHDPTKGMTNFILPSGSSATGALGIINARGEQTIVATASTNTAQIHRITIFPDAALTISVANYIDRPEDKVLYGTCTPPES